MKVFGLKAIKKNKILVGLVVSIMLAMTAGSFALSGMKTSVRLQTATTPSVALRSAASEFTVEGGTCGENEDYHYSYNVLSIHPQSSGTTITIKNTNPEEVLSHIEIAPIDGGNIAKNVNIILAGININTNAAGIKIKDDATFNVNIMLADGSENILSSRAQSDAGLQKNGSGNDVGILTIGVLPSSKGTGKLTVTGGTNSSAIGGGESNGSIKNIIIAGGTVTANGGWGGSGIGGGYKGSGSNITISGGTVTAIGGENGGAGIGSGSIGSSGTGNSINGNAVVLAGTSGKKGKTALEGFADSDLKQGIAFTRQTTSGAWSGVMYGNVALSKELEIPANLTVPAGQTLSIEENCEVTLSEKTGAKYTIQGELRNNGTVTLPTDLALSGNGKVTTKTDFYLDDDSLYNTGYQTYRTSAGVQNYSNLPNPYQLDPANGKRFINWYYINQADQQVAISESVNVLLNEHSFYENSIEQFTVTFSVPTGTAPSAQTVDTGSKATDPQLSWADGTVEGWYKDQAFTPANKWNFGTDTVTGNITLYAKFQCTVTFNPNYSGGSSTTGTAVYNNPVAEPTTPPARTGYRFDGWYKESACTNKWTFTTAVTRNTTLYAKWVQQFTVTFSVPTGTAPAAQTIDDGSKATAPQFSWTDGTVEGWYTDQAFTPANKWNFGTDTVTGNITLYAKFQCTVTFDPNYSGGSEVTSQTVVYDNTVPEPDEPTKDGYSFVEWCKDEECTTAWDFENDRVQGDMTLYAKWLGDEHNVIIPTNPDDHGTVTTDPENPKTGDEVIITVTPEEGYEIDGLPIVKTEDGRIIEVIPTGNPNEYKFIMPDSDVTIEVNFVLISEPTVDPGVKTGDSFTGIAALAVLSVATTGAALLRKRK